MKTIQVLSLPSMNFAIAYDAPSYRTHFSAVPQKIEITYIYKGSLSVIEKDGEYRLEEGDLLINLYTSERSIIAENYHCHHTACALFERHIGEDLPDGLIMPVRIPAKLVSPDAYRLIDHMIFLQNMQMLDSIRGKTEFLELLCIADSCCKTEQNAKLPNGIYLANKAKKYISEHICEPITQRQIADYLGITSGYLCDVFKEACGETLMHYVNSIKLRNIHTLMENKSISLREASAIFGYTDPNYVSRLYKKIFGQNITFRI